MDVDSQTGKSLVSRATCAQTFANGYSYVYVFVTNLRGENDFVMLDASFFSSVCGTFPSK